MFKRKQVFLVYVIIFKVNINQVLDARLVMIVLF